MIFYILITGEGVPAGWEKEGTLPKPSIMRVAQTLGTRDIKSAAFIRAWTTGGSIHSGGRRGKEPEEKTAEGVIRPSQCVSATVSESRGSRGPPCCLCHTCQWWGLPVAFLTHLSHPVFHLIPQQQRTQKFTPFDLESCLWATLCTNRPSLSAPPTCPTL